MKQYFLFNKVISCLYIFIKFDFQDVKTQIWGYGEPSNTAWVLIKNCKNVEIDLSCTIYRRSFESLTIENVENLVFTRTEYTLKHPIKLILKNISYIETIPENTFSISRMVSNYEIYKDIFTLKYCFIPV